MKLAAVVLALGLLGCRDSKDVPVTEANQFHAPKGLPCAAENADGVLVWTTCKQATEYMRGNP